MKTARLYITFLFSKEYAVDYWTTDTLETQLQVIGLICFWFVLYDVCFPTCTFAPLKTPSFFWSLRLTPNAASSWRDAAPLSLLLLLSSAFDSPPSRSPSLSSPQADSYCSPLPIWSYSMSPLQFTADACTHVPESGIELPFEAWDDFKRLPYHLLSPLLFSLNKGFSSTYEAQYCPVWCCQLDRRCLDRWLEADFDYGGQTCKLLLLTFSVSISLWQVILTLFYLLTGCLCFFSGGFGQSLSEGERTGCAGVAEGQVFGDIAIG